MIKRNKKTSIFCRKDFTISCVIITLLYKIHMEIGRNVHPDSNEKEKGISTRIQL